MTTSIPSPILDDLDPTDAAIARDYSDPNGPRKPLREVAAALRISSGEVERRAWKVEPVAWPSLRFDPTPENVLSAATEPDPFSGGKLPRAARLAYRAGVSEARVRDLYAEATGEDFSTRYPGRGRRHAESRFSGFSTEAIVPVREAIRAARAEGLRGDASVAARAAEILSEATADARAKRRRTRSAK